ncbi:lipopolysaccharide transport periplasmic protein LptA [Spongiibacter sp. KMU-158]|uniref:Lipopolysaccharide export system protein LptA n=1 Tax=Spongiibacter pelagi TaxID=2760804 RepID=A0A927C514_9GAMM|nr:lipopolysaccharide transport periplasmic protein LptA [Spongiibacter pelagi]MBD2859706.1 lipopolysaccharide transport periplasmic protein LptA [Spongiibacter pelagi]
MNLKSLLFISALAYANLVSALPDDRSQAINLSSDSASYESNQGTYTGNVEMSQGSLKIKADKLTIVESERKVDTVIAEGAPASFEQQTNASEGVVTASANRIEYRIDNEEILLLNNAEISHQGSRISGDRIFYNGRKQTVVADGGNTEQETRVKMILQPQAAPETKPSTIKPGSEPATKKEIR